MKLFVYNGPSVEFADYVETLIPGELDSAERLHFSTISDEISSRSHSLRVHSEDETPVKDRVNKSYLICSKDDYSSITSAGINSFSNLSELYSFENIILHNPPKKLVEKICSRNSIEKPSYKSYQYVSISNKHILGLKAELDSRIIGQTQVIQKVLASLLMSSSIQDNDKSPLVIMLYGASGSGKTEMAKIISEVIDGSGNLFRKQLSMHQNNQSANYLFGSEHSEESLARDLMQRKSNVILFDEFDKLNQSLYSAFYQLFDEGVFEDNNYSVSTSGAIIICTSNFNSEDEMKISLGEPIFSRFDACIKFSSLSSVYMKEVAKKIYSKYYSELEDSQKEVLNLSDRGIEGLIDTLSTEIKNVRIMENYVRQRIASILLDDFLDKSKKQ